ncbi:hypothetical protein BH24DEI2_BH24DEI2_10920 [soil metagenome]
MMARLKHRLETLPTPAPVRWRRLPLVALACLAVAAAAWFVYQRQTPPPPDAATVAAVAAQVYLQDAEVAARLAVLRGWLQDRREVDDIVPLYTAATDLLQTSHQALEPLGLHPTWTELQPTVQRLGVQIADGDAGATATLDDLTETLGKPAP